MRDKLGVWDQQIHTTIYKTDKQQGPTEYTGNYIQELVTAYHGKNLKKNIYTYICVYGCIK